MTPPMRYPNGEAWLEAPLHLESRTPFLLEFATLRERPLAGGGIDVEILIPGEYPRGGQFTYKTDVNVLAQFILWRVWPKKHFTNPRLQQQGGMGGPGPLRASTREWTCSQIRRDREWPELHQGNRARERTPADDD